MEQITGKELAATLSDYCNGRGEGCAALVAELARDHRTIQQSITSLMLAWFKHLSETEYFDGRNEAAVMTARAIMAALDGRDKLPLI